jgi:hypothetical protein
MFWVMFVMIRLAITATVIAVLAGAYLVWLLIAGSVMLVASMRGNQRVVTQTRSSLKWKLPKVS